MELERRSFDLPDELRQMAALGDIAVVAIGNGTVARATHEPGWRWSEHAKPVVGTDSCQGTHVGYVLTGHIHVVMDDGAELGLGPGDVMAIPPGHDAWVIGDEPCVMLDFAGLRQTGETR